MTTRLEQILDFLGSKALMLPELLHAVTGVAPAGDRVIDLFSGTGIVSRHFADNGYEVHANDVLPLASVWARAQITVDEVPRFSGLVGVELQHGSEYESVIDHLKSLEPVEGWVTRSFTPRSAAISEHSRQYFTVQNGMRIDAIRMQVRAWRPYLTSAENSLLRCALVAAADRVSNTAGTYGSYLKSWKRSALVELQLRPLDFKVRDMSHVVTQDDAQAVAEQVDAGVAYIDPPYTKRQYAAYYHVLNALVEDAEADVSGKTGLGDWRRWESAWCYSRKAPAALESLAKGMRARSLVMSYSSDGHIPHETVLEILGSQGKTTFTEVRRRRFRSSALEHRSTHVFERVYVVTR
jgi:adenine-specific DNA-methyltransferase